MGELGNRCAAVVQRFGGTVNQLAGDGISIDYVGAKLTPNRHRPMTQRSDHYPDGRTQHGPRRAPRAA